MSADEDIPDMIISGKFWKKGDKYKMYIQGEETKTIPCKDMSSYYEDVVCKDDFIQKIKDSKKLSFYQLSKQYDNLIKYDASVNKTSFCGNPVIYHYFIDGLLNTKYKGKSFIDNFNKDKKRMLEQVAQMDRRKTQPIEPIDFFELNRSVVFFKPTQAKHLVDYYCRRNSLTAGRIRVLDCCGGWGSRLLGIMSHPQVKYVKVNDTNKDLIQKYKHIAYDIEKRRQVLYPDTYYETETQYYDFTCKDAIEFLGDCEKNDDKYDLFLTSPPYYNLEIYPHMKKWVSEQDYYKWLKISMISAFDCLTEDYGWAMWNVSPKIYETLITHYNIRPCDTQIDLKQQKNKRKDSQDKIYVWEKTPEKSSVYVSPIYYGEKDDIPA